MMRWLRRSRHRTSGVRHSLRRALRGFILALGVSGLVYLGLLYLAPYIVTTTLVRGTLEQAFSDWTGHHATIDGAPRLHFWPEPEIELPDVTIYHGRGDDEVVLGRIESVRASFGLLAGLAGRPVLDEFQLTRPELMLTRDRDGTINWESDGFLHAAVLGARTGQSPEAAKDIGFGEMTITGGRLEIEDALTGHNFSIEDIDARIDWSKLSAPMALAAQATISGKRFGIELGSKAPLALFGGQDGSLRLAVSASGLTGRFEGTANLSRDYLLNGALRVAVSDAPAFLAWSGLKLRGMAHLREAELSATVTTIGSAYRLDQLAASFDGSDVKGIIELTPPAGDRRTQLDGTLAFERIDLDDLLDAFMLLPEGAGGDRMATGAPDWLDVDLTLSAEQANLAPFEMTELATSIAVSGDERRFDIVDASLAGGELSASIVDATSERPGRVQLSLRNANFATLADLVQAQGPVPRASGNLGLSLTLAKPLAMTRLADLDGSVQLDAGPGAIRPLDVVAIQTLAQDRPFFRLSEVPGGDLTFSRLVLAARLARGSAEFTQAVVDSDLGTLSIHGIVPFASNALALSATLEALDTVGVEPGEATTEAPEPLLQVFIGGSWPDPIISPILSPLPRRSGEVSPPASD